MISKRDQKKYARRALNSMRKANITLSKAEEKSLEVADFGLDRVEEVGLQIVVYENNDRYCAKELVLLPHQICPEHRHPCLGEQNAGKQETFRCRQGKVYLYVEGDPTLKPKARIPKAKRDTFTAWKEIVLRPGDQFTIPPNTLHWFQGGKRGAIISEFSSPSSDETDIFTDPEIQRITQVLQ